MRKIKSPVVLIHKRENSDTYAVAITSGSQNYHDAVLMATMEPDMIGDDVDTWSKTGYYMAAEIEILRRICAEAYQCVGYLAEECRATDDSHVIKLMDNLSRMKLVHEDLLPFQLSDDAPANTTVNDVTNGNPLTITLPALPILGSKEEWYQGFAAGAGSMREECAAALISAGIGVEVK